jgi:hypothetical protein
VFGALALRSVGLRRLTHTAHCRRGFPLSHEPGDEHVETSQRDDWRGIPDRPSRQVDLQGDANTDAEGRAPTAVEESGGVGTDDDAAPAAVEPLPEAVRQLVPVIVQQVQANLHLPSPMPDAAGIAELKRADPKAYSMWLRLTEKRANHDMWIEKAPIRTPARIARTGQLLGLVAVLAVLALAGYALYNHEPWVAGFLAAIDVVALAAVFAKSRTEA